MTTTATRKVTRPLLTQVLNEAGIAKAEYRNSSAQRPLNEGFYLQYWDRTLAGKTEKFVTVYYETLRNQESDAPYINQKVAEMSEALTNAGIAHEVKHGFNWDEIKIVR